MCLPIEQDEDGDCWYITAVQTFLDRIAVWTDRPNPIDDLDDDWVDQARTGGGQVLEAYVRFETVGIGGLMTESLSSAHFESPDLVPRHVYFDGPIAMQFSVPERFYSPDAPVWWGENPFYDDGTSPLTASHAVAVVGYLDGGQTLVCRNSWGREWGDAGHFTIRVATRLNMRFFTCLPELALSLVDPKTNPVDFQRFRKLLAPEDTRASRDSSPSSSITTVQVIVASVWLVLFGITVAIHTRWLFVVLAITLIAGVFWMGTPRGVVSSATADTRVQITDHASQFQPYLTTLSDAGCIRPTTLKEMVDIHSLACAYTYEDGVLVGVDARGRLIHATDIELGLHIDGIVVDPEYDVRDRTWVLAPRGLGPFYRHVGTGAFSQTYTMDLVTGSGVLAVDLALDDTHFICAETLGSILRLGCTPTVVLFSEKVTPELIAEWSDVCAELDTDIGTWIVVDNVHRYVNSWPSIVAFDADDRQLDPPLPIHQDKSHRLAQLIHEHLGRTNKEKRKKTERVELY
jgi:hypothetical protein